MVFFLEYCLTTTLERGIGQMGKWKETQEAYHGENPAQEKVIPEKMTMKDEISYKQLMESLEILRAVCKMNESCTRCWLYDPEEKETACLICKAEGNSLADNIRAARDTICLSNVNLAARKIKETNGDRIRRMTDEELADFLLSEKSDVCTHCEFHGKDFNRCTLENPCVKELASTMLLDWLASEKETSPGSSPAETADVEKN